jgi:hypothetical protein
VNLNVIQQPAVSGGGPALATDPVWNHSGAAWLRDTGFMLALGLLFALLTWWRLVRVKSNRRG